MARGSYCGKCGETHRDGECKMEAAEASGPPPASRESRKGKRTHVMDGVSKKDADAWIKKMGTEVGGTGNVLGHPKKRHYEAVPDPENPGKFILELVEDE